MISNYETMSYRQLQTVAKNTKIPANLKKSYLIKLLIARSKGNENQVLKIIQEAQYERTNNRGIRAIRSNRILMEESSKFKSVQTRHPNTELEKLLKAPLSSKIRKPMLDNRISRYLNNSFINLRKKNIPRQRGKPNKTIEHQHINSSGNQGSDTDSDTNSIKFGEMNTNPQTRLPPMQSWNKGQDYQTMFMNPMNSGDNGIMNFNTDPNSYSAVKSNIITETTNIKMDEYKRCFEHEQIFSQRKTQKLASSETFNMPDIYQNHQITKENYIVINQHIKFYGPMIPENRKLIQEHYMKDPIPENPINHEMGSHYHYDEYHDNDNVPHTDGMRHGNHALTSSSNMQKYSKYSKNVLQNSTTTVNNNVSNLMYNPKNLKNQFNYFSNEVNTNRLNPNLAINSVPYPVEMNRPIGYCSNSNIDIIDEPDSKLQKKNIPDQKTIGNDDILKELLGLELRCDIDDDISSSLLDYFESLDIPPNVENVTILSSDDVPVSSEEEVYTSQQYDADAITPPSIAMGGIPTSMLCFKCDWIGKISEFHSHIRSKHSNDILITNDGVLTIAVNMGIISKRLKNQQKQCFIEHGDHLFIIHLKFKYPDIILPILLAVPQDGRNTIEEKNFAKFYMQIINFVSNEETLWSGTVECMNAPGRPLDVDVFSNRKHGIFEISMRYLDLVPNNIPLKDIADYLDGCVVELHIFIDTLTQLQRKPR